MDPRDIYLEMDDVKKSLYLLQKQQDSMIRRLNKIIKYHTQFELPISEISSILDPPKNISPPQVAPSIAPPHQIKLIPFPQSELNQELTEITNLRMPLIHRPLPLRPSDKLYPRRLSVIQNFIDPKPH